jgi:SAM-dependent methyltransferase
MSFADHFSRQAADYTRYRPRYPDALFAFLASQCRQRQLALDIATGNGQAAVQLCDHFTDVIGCEPSLSQLHNADTHASLGYVCSTAEQLPFSSEQFDLITVAQAAHWFDHPRFHAEATRILKPGGLLAVWCYGLFNIEPEIDSLINQYYGATLNAYWPPERHWIEKGYAGLPFPFATLDTPVFYIEVSWNLEQVLGYLYTWSATQRYIAGHDDNPLLVL